MAKRFVIALDESENCDWAFNYTTSAMNKHLDELHLVTIRNPDSSPALGVAGAYAYDLVLKEREAEIQRCKKILRGYARRAHQLGITTPLKLTLGTGEVGEILCDYIPKNKIDFLVMGRRGMGTFKRLFLGSNSKYCVEHADCNVIIIKHPFGPEEVHEGSKAEAIAAEEEERQWRIHEYEKKLEAEAKQQEEDSKKDLELVKKMEEEERERREKEDHGGESVSGRDE